MMQVPLFDLKEQYRLLEPEILEVLPSFLRQQQFTLGASVEQFEKSFAEYCQAPFSVGLSSGTDALLVALEALEIGAGDEVIVPAFSFYCTGSVVIRRGSKPVFVDISLDDFNMDMPAAIAAISSRTKAIIPVHLFGQSAKMDTLIKAADQKQISIIEDAAQAVGAEYKGTRVGNLGRFGAFSFYPTKNLGAFGDGGALTMQTHEDYEKIKMLRMHGSRQTYEHEAIGGCFRLDALQAIVLSIKLRHLEKWHLAREQHARFYRENLEGVGNLILPTVDPERRHVFNQYVIRTQQRDALKKHLADRGVGSGIYYPKIIPLQPGMANLGHREGEFPQAEKASREVLALPIFPELTETNLKKVTDDIRSFFA